MSDMFSSSSLQLAFVLSVIVLAVFGYGYSAFIRQMHVGYGMTLTRRESDGTVHVIAVLKDSPADKAGIKKYAQVISVDHVPMIFLMVRHSQAIT